MSDCRRSVDEMKAVPQACKDFSALQTSKFYDSWAKTYEQDVETLDYRAPHQAVDLLMANFSGSPEEVQVLDVACGSGLVAKLMFELGFRHFVGVDSSKGMLDQAAETGLYQDLRLALLGPEPLPAQPGLFDVVIIVGSLNVGFVPISVVRELCRAAKPGGLVCMARGDHTRTPSDDYKKDLERELQLMEEEGLWSLVGTKQVDRHMLDSQLNPESHISGSVHLYKCIDPAVG